MEKKARIVWFGKHFGEEPPLVGDKSQGAGGIFFTNCNLRCVFCQNYQISHGKVKGKEYTPKQLAGIMLELQEKGAVNIDLVSPTIWVLPVREAILSAKKNGLKIPVVWNSNAFESEGLLRRVEGLVDIYLPDFKYGDDKAALKYSNAKNYSKIAEKAIREMLKQAGRLKIEKGIAKKGVLVRHLLLPGNIENSFKALEILARIDKNIYLSLMSQYFPLNLAGKFPEINRQISKKEFQKVFDYAAGQGLENGWFQESGCLTPLAPDFTRQEPFG